MHHNFGRAYIKDNHWLPLEGRAGQLIVLTTDPE
jgi:hypothetical protein